MGGCAIKEVAPLGSSRDRTESELTKVLGLRRAGTTHENSPADSRADVRNELPLGVVDEIVVGGLAAAIEQQDPDAQLAVLLQLRRAATTYENHPEQREGEGRVLALTEKSTENVMKLARLKR